MRHRLLALPVVLVPAACGLLPDTPAPAPLDLAGVAGSYALTEEVEVAIEPAEGGDAWTFRIGEGEPREIAPAGGHRWVVPDLGLRFRALRQGDALLLQVERYGEEVLLPPRWSGPAFDRTGRTTVEVLEALTPRLMIALDVPGTSIALVRSGEIAWTGQFGVTRSGTADRVDERTVFEAASMSKPAYAYAFLSLVEDGAMRLDVPLVHYLGQDYLAGEPLHREITARMVLTHTTGFPNWRRGGELTVNFPPGTQLGYSGEGFQFLQTAAEAVTRMSTEAFVQERLLGPLGMASSSYEWQEAYEERYATGHTAEGEPRERRPYASANTAYTLYTTPADYARLLMEIMREDRSADHSLGPETVAEMLAPQVHGEGRRPIARGRGERTGEVHFALGWRVDVLPSGKRYHHSGSNSTGHQCYAEFDPGTGDGIVIMTNSSSGSPLWRGLMRAVGAP